MLTICSSATGFAGLFLKSVIKLTSVALLIFLKASALTKRYKVFPVFGFACNRYKNGWWAFVRKRVGKKP
jgi:hypothetical protein